MKQYLLYIMASKKNGTLYIGVTNNLVRRVYEHKEGLIEGFTKKYNVKYLVYYEVYNDMYEAIKREKAMKKWLRKWKIELIEKTNPDWKDLYEEIVK
ncbi:MAG: GIY-YIG nuclease family protein [Ignavibacteriaceae bacterium]